jgi:hypothetical protein
VWACHPPPRDDPRLAPVRTEPNVAIRSTHEAVLTTVRLAGGYPVQAAA